MCEHKINTRHKRPVKNHIPLQLVFLVATRRKHWYKIEDFTLPPTRRPDLY